MRARRAAPSLVLLLGTHLTACVHGAGDDPAFAVTDSAGVRIAESAGPLWASGEEWRLSDEPLVDIGEAEGDERYLFSWIAGAVLAPDGSFVVLDPRAASLRAFEPDGTFRWSAGRRGDGPGEFSRPQSVRRLTPDSLLVFDPERPGGSIFTSGGVFVRSFTVRIPGAVAYGVRDVAPLPDGTLVLMTGGSTSLLDGPPPKSGSSARERDPVLRVSMADGTLLDTVGVYPGMEWYASDDGIGTLPFAPLTSFAVRDSTLLVGTAEDFSVDLHALDGRRISTIRVSGMDLSVRDEDMEAYRAMRMSLVRDEQARERVARRLADLPRPERKGAYAMMRVDADGNVWLFEVPVGTLYPTRASVLSAQGRYLGDVELPDHFLTLTVGSDRMVGVWWDELDVQHVRVYAIVK